MKDEEFAFRSDCREKSVTARSARNKRTHCGKGGRVKFPSDNLSKKELQAMNGEVKSYRLNEPLKWAEFREMPDDLKITYIKLLRERFNVPDCRIADMMGVNKVTFSHFMKTLGISSGSRTRGGDTKWSDSAWFAWVDGAPVPATMEETPEAVEQPVVETPEYVVPFNSETTERLKASLEEICDPVPAPVLEVKVLPVREEKRKAIPCSGSLNFEGRVEDVLNTVSVLLGGGKCPYGYYMGSMPGRCGGC